jgi:hypothetical protein
MSTEPVILDASHSHGTKAIDDAIAALQLQATALSARISALENAPIVVPPPQPPVPIPPTASGAFGSAWIDTKDNIQIRRNGNGDVCIQLRKVGTGPITGIRIQDRFGPVYSNGTGGTYSVSVVIGSPDGQVIASCKWLPGTNGGKADAAFPTIMFDAASTDVLDGTRFWVRFLNVDAKPDSNYVSLNVLMVYGADPSPRQPGIPDSDLAVLVNTGSGWTDRGETPGVDVLPNHEGFGYTQCLTGYWKPIGGSNQVREVFTCPSLTFSKIAVRLRGDSSRPITVTLLSTGALGHAIVSGDISGIPPSAPGGDNSGQTIGTLTVPQTTIPAGNYILLLTAPTGATYTATPVRKALKGSYPTLTSDWQSPMTPGYAEYSADGGKTWASLYGNPNQTDVQFSIS